MNRIFYDTGCYRAIAKEANYDLRNIDSFIAQIKQKENQLGYDSYLPYLVVTELITRLADLTTNHYPECKYGLYAAMKHVEFKSRKFVGSIEAEIKNVICCTNGIGDIEKSLFECASDLAKIIFKHPSQVDKYIEENKPQIQQASTYLQEVKTNWINSFKIFSIPDDIEEKNKKRLILKESRKSELIYLDFAVGICKYVVKKPGEELFTDRLLIRIINRFKPLFDLQFRIINLLYEGGYNLEKNNRPNDIIDYLIVGNLDIPNTVFVTNDQKLFKYLQELGYINNIVNYQEWIKPEVQKSVLEI